MKKSNLAAAFGHAPSMPKAATKKAKKNSRAEIELGIALEKLGAFRITEKLLKNESSILYDQVKEQVLEMALETALEGEVPESFVGTSGRVTASIEFKKLPSNRALDPEFAERLMEEEIPVEKSVSIPDRFVINPDLSQKAIDRLVELQKSDPILKKEIVVLHQEEEYKYTVTDKTLETLIEKGDDELIEESLESLMQISIGKFHLDGQNIEEGKGDEKEVTSSAKIGAFEILQEMGVFPRTEPKRK